MAANAAKRSPKGSKRRNERNILTFYEKIAVIRYYDDTNISRNSLAKMFHCCATQIRRILERKEELLQQLATLSEADASIIIEEMTRKRRKFEMSAISFILHQWVERCRQLRLRKSITNQTLKETALKMAAILNLPAFRPSYRWLNRFRGKYKYNDEDLGALTAANAVTGELAVEDIIIEYKDALPNFMQKEIMAITSSAKAADEKQAHADLPILPIVPLYANENANANANANANENANSNDYELSDDDDDDDVDVDADADAEEDEPEFTDNRDVSVAAAVCTGGQPSKTIASDDSPLDSRITAAGTTALLSGVFPHLAVIHQFALLNSDVKALELISQLGVHMQTQASGGAYKQLSLATALSQDADSMSFDDIVLIE